MLHRTSVAALVVAALALGGCASTSSVERRSDLLESRVAELEQANRTLVLRLDAYEASVTLVEDEVTALKNTVKRGARSEELAVVKVEPPRKAERAEESYYASTLPTTVLAPRSSDLGSYEGDDAYAVEDPYAAEDEGYIDIVVSQDKLDRYFGSRSEPAPVRSAGTGGSVGKRTPLPNVVEGDRLPAAGGSKVASAAPGAEAGTDAYKEGLKYYRQGQFAEAIAQFKRYLDSNPPEDYVDNALYWLGECYYGLAEYAEAASYFHRIVQDYPNANKVPDALLKVGLTYQRLGKTDSAHEVMYYLIEAFPDSEAARTAKDKIEQPSAS